MTDRRQPRNSPTAHPRIHRGALLSLFAMLMIFIGPLLSQSMPMGQHEGMAMPMSATMDISMQHASSHDPEHHAPVSADDHALWAKCGYCTLLFSCPALFKTLAVIALAPPRPADFFNTTTQPGHARSAIFPHARSRAPPLLNTR